MAILRPDFNFFATTITQKRPLAASPRWVGGACKRPRDALRNTIRVSVPGRRLARPGSHGRRALPACGSRGNANPRPIRASEVPAPARPPWAGNGRGGRAAEGSAADLVMLRGLRSPLWPLLLLLLLLLPPPGTWGHGSRARPREGAEEAGSAGSWPAFQGLRERLRAAGALCRRSWALFSCRVWPDGCRQDEEAPARPPGKTRRLRRAGARGLDARGTMESGHGGQSLAPALGHCDRGHQAGALAAGFAIPPSIWARLRAGSLCGTRKARHCPRSQPWRSALVRTSGPGCAPPRRPFLTPPDGSHFLAVSEPALALFQGAALAHLLDGFKESPRLDTPPSTFSFPFAASGGGGWAVSPPDLSSDLFSVTDRL